MFDLLEASALSSLTKFIPAYRFARTDDTIIDRHPMHESALDSDSIKVLNWNIAKNNHEENWAKDFLEILEEYQPDLIFLQEVRLCAETRHMEELLEMSWNFAPNFIDTYENAYFGILTATKSRHLSRKSMITKHYEPITNTPKVSLLTEYPLFNSSETLLTINTHLINFVDLDSFQAQLDELEATIAHHQGAIIFAGDFNVWSRSRWQLLKEMADRLGLIQASFTASDTLKIKRFLLSPPLDYIFYRGLNENQISAKVFDQISSSDHNPMLVEFSYCKARNSKNRSDIIETSHR
jgi:endonuclease/exonuclease/phosphatase (EEP) superfamily protein YafD